MMNKKGNAEVLVALMAQEAARASFLSEDDFNSTEFLLRLPTYTKIAKEMLDILHENKPLVLNWLEADILKKR
jgi:hypothetical protein